MNGICSDERRDSAALVVDLAEVQTEALGDLSVDELLIILYRRAGKYPNKFLPVVCSLAKAMGKIHVIESYLEQERERILSGLSDEFKARLKAMGAFIE